MSESRRQRTQRPSSRSTAHHEAQPSLLLKTLYASADSARNSLTAQGLRNVLSVFKNLDVLLVDRNKINEQKGTFEAKGVFLFM